MIRLASLFNCESSRPITTLQILETIDRNTRGTSRELQETRLLLGIPAANAFPEVLDDLVILCVATVISVFLPVFDVNVCDTANKQLELTFVEDVYKICGDQLVETRDEGLELFFDTFLNAPFRNESKHVSTFSWKHAVGHLLDVFVLVLVGNFDLVTSWLQFDANSFTKALIVSRKRQLKGIGNVVVPAFVSFSRIRAQALNSQHPFQIAVEVGVHTLHVLQRDLLP